EVVEHDQRVLAVIAEVLADRGTGERRQELHGSRITRGSGHDDAVFHGMVFFECLHYPGDGRTLLPDGYIDTEDTQALLIDDGIDGDGGLARLTIADDQFALSA